ncbi:hypothetical protein [Candidatus Nitrotoga arctica]|uniref:PD-(D/E)XK nuclease superfamily protein n=1 Tax=Candidatus Nitrotoga arctica TaxID=453162 RepID=A0ABM8Z147_9PROT|nr:hypothetical protein [Candidatus Nitrotoga arctica]CAG9933594.1 protein of unknown function [Candidatus Nitrotoga arctica]
MLPEQKDGKQVWRMIEVKSSTSVKDYHRDDVTVQAFVAQSAGVPLEAIALAHIDSSWIYPGNEDYQGLLKENDLTAEAFSRTDEVKGWIAQAQSIAAEPSEPAIGTGDHCGTPFECGFYDYCSRDEPKPEHPINWLPRFSSTKEKELTIKGVYDLKDVPDNLLNDKQQRVKDYTLANEVFSTLLVPQQIWLRMIFPPIFSTLKPSSSPYLSGKVPV